jgi:hypothetical protein
MHSPTTMPDTAPALPGPLQRHMAGTYFALRVGIAVIGAALPIVLWLGGLIVDGQSLLGSMSAYYHFGMRNVFVGALVAIGAFLYLYKGFSTAENVALNVAGLMAVGVALFPTNEPGAPRDTIATLHAAFAIVFFIAIAYVAIARASDTLSLVRDTERAESLRRVYRTLGTLMVASPAIAVVLSSVFDPASPWRSIIFFVEAAGVWVFAAYWLAKSLELRETDAERLAVEGKLRPASSPGKASGPGRLLRTAV